MDEKLICELSYCFSILWPLNKACSVSKKEKRKLICYRKVKVQVSQSCPTLRDPTDYTVHGILQARILEWVAFPFSGQSSQPRIKPKAPALQVDSLPAEPQGKPYRKLPLLDKEIATHSSIRAWEIPRTEAPRRLYGPWSRKESETTDQLTLRARQSVEGCYLCFWCWSVGSAGQATGKQVDEK